MVLITNEEKKNHTTTKQIPIITWIKYQDAE